MRERLHVAVEVRVYPPARGAADERVDVLVHWTALCAVDVAYEHDDGVDAGVRYLAQVPFRELVQPPGRMRHARREEMLARLLAALQERGAAEVHQVF